MTKRNLFRVVLAAAVLAYVGYAQLKPANGTHRPDTASESTPLPAPVRKLGILDFHPCTLAPKVATATVDAQCAHMLVPEDYAHADGRKIQLAIAWIPAHNADMTDPVFMLAGGPGQSALDSYPGIAPAFEETLKKRSVILVDQRGTGASNPLECEDKSGGKTSVEQEAAEASPDVLRRFTEHCRDTLAAKADLRFYSTTEAIRDLDAVRAAIGAEQIDLVGISYGTRVAQHYARRYPTHTRAVVLDSVAPNELILGNDFARNLDDALALNFKECSKIPKCVERMGDPRANLAALLAHLTERPEPVNFRDPVTGEMREETLTRGSLALVARMYAYLPALEASLPLTLAEAMKGRYEPLMAQAKLVGGNLGETMAAGMQLSVICTEDADGLKVDPAYADGVLGNEMIDTLRTQCAVWPHGERPSDFHQPLVSDLPILVLEGEFDPVTPPRYGEQVIKNLSHGRLLILKGQGHNVIPVGCMPKLMARFLDTADAKALDAHCLDKLPYTPPFTSYSGWEP
ncbi:MAG TPA: alpha/beta fold hydrolase [Xanthomonadaceae bacterium]|nr:alpha/beta fold hydrolase [Xanthomonadaceae bacterium]